LRITTVDVGDPEAPASRGTVAVPWIRDLGVRGSFAFVSGENVLEVLDLGNPIAPAPAGSITLLGYVSEESVASYSEGLAYVEVSRRCTNPFDTGSCTGSSGLEIIDVSPSSCASLNPVTGMIHISCFDSDMGAFWVDLRLVSFSPLPFELDAFGRTVRTGGGCATLNPRSGIVTAHRVRTARMLQLPRTGSLHRVLQMQGGGHADVLSVLQVAANTADAVPCEGLPGIFHVPCVSYRSTAFSLDLAVRPGLPVRLDVAAVGAVSP